MHKYLYIINQHKNYPMSPTKINFPDFSLIVYYHFREKKTDDFWIFLGTTCPQLGVLITADTSPKYLYLIVSLVIWLLSKKLKNEMKLKKINILASLRTSISSN